MDTKRWRPIYRSIQELECKREREKVMAFCGGTARSALVTICGEYVIINDAHQLVATKHPDTAAQERERVMALCCFLIDQKHKRMHKRSHGWRNARESCCRQVATEISKMNTEQCRQRESRARKARP